MKAFAFIFGDGLSNDGRYSNINYFNLASRFNALILISISFSAATDGVNISRSCDVPLYHINYKR